MGLPPEIMGRSRDWTGLVGEVDSSDVAENEPNALGDNEL